MLTERQFDLLEALVREYIRTAEPVASDRLVQRAGIEASSATVRNDLVALEDEGYLAQPHVSSGRAPTELAYRFYIEHCIRPNSRRLKVRIRLPKPEHAESDAILVRAARVLAELTGESVIIGYKSRAQSYGISNLFGKPEFQDTSRVMALASMLDNLNDIMEALFDDFENGLKIMLGRENPFVPECGAIFASVRPSRRERALLGVFGPMRMDYERNMAILEQLRKLM